MKKKYNFTKKDLLLVAILSITILFCNYSIRWHFLYKEHSINNSIILKYLVEVSDEEFSNYIIENPNTFVYFGTTGDEKTIDFEKKFEIIINKYFLKDKAVYVKDIDLNTFLVKYDVNLKKIAASPVIVYFEEGKIIDYINYENSNMSNKTIIRFFRLYEEL